MIKKISIFLFILIAASSSAHAEDRRSWTAMDTYLQTTFLAFVVVDWRQTREFTGNPHKYPGKCETNPLLGAHPSAREVNQVIAGSMLAHTAIAYLLPRPYRTIWQSLWIGVEISAVSSNAAAGISVRF